MEQSNALSGQASLYQTCLIAFVARLELDHNPANPSKEQHLYSLLETLLGLSLLQISPRRIIIEELTVEDITSR